MRPSNASVTLIWHDNRLSARTSKAKSSMSSSIDLGLADLGLPIGIDIDMASCAGTGAAAFGLDPGDQVLLGRLHDRHPGIGRDRLRFSIGLDERDLGHARAAPNASETSMTAINPVPVIHRQRSYGWRRGESSQQRTITPAGATRHAAKLSVSRERGNIQERQCRTSPGRCSQPAAWRNQPGLAVPSPSPGNRLLACGAAYSSGNRSRM